MFSGHHCKYDIKCTVCREMHLFFLSMVPRSDTELSQETLYRSEYCKIG